MGKREVRVFLRGGLGNQLFQYALGLEVSRQSGRNLVIREDLLPLTEDTISGISRWPNQILSFAHSGSTRAQSHQPNGGTNLFGKIMQLQRMIGDRAPHLLEMLGLYAAETKEFKSLGASLTRVRSINGYASSRSYALLGRAELTSQLKDLKSPSPQFKELYSDSTLIYPTLVHLRLGDYQGLTEIYGELGEKYIADALSEVNSTANPIWLFTQDAEQAPKWLMDILKPARIIDQSVLSSPLENLIIMASGFALVCSNSTMSWWSAFMHQHPENVVAPRFLGKTNIFTDDMMLEGWKLIDAD
jgi:hypothetical protein